MDVAKDGIALYEYDDKELHKPKPKTPEQALAMAREYFDEWYPMAAGRLETAKYTRGQGRLKEAEFETQRSTEFLYHCVRLVCTLYTPHVHILGLLSTKANRTHMRLFYT